MFRFARHKKKKKKNCKNNKTQPAGVDMQYRPTATTTTAAIIAAAATMAQEIKCA